MALDNVHWSFSEVKYASEGDFNEAIADYNDAIAEDMGRPNVWNSEEIIIEEAEIQIQYMAWIDEPCQILSNERLCDEDADAFEKEGDEDGYQVEIIARLKANNGRSFSALEFMFKVHNQQVNKDLGDHVFFEGIADEPMIDAATGLKTWYIPCGS